MISIEKWLKKKLRIEVAQNLLLALVSGMGGLAVLTITFLFTYAIVWFCVNFGASGLSQLVSNKPLHITHQQILIVCSIFLVLLFIGNARTSREDLSNYTLDHPAAPALFLSTGVTGSLLGLLANPDASGKMVADILYTGPRLIAGSVKAFQRSTHLMAIDTLGCACALDLLQKNSHHVPCTELAEQLAGHDVVRIFTQLRGMDGVLFLDTTPPAITLTDGLREDLLHC
jgi:hypothetical protein